MISGSRIEPGQSRWRRTSWLVSPQTQGRALPRSDDKRRPPPPLRPQLTLLDLVLFGLVLTALAYAAYRINDVLAYRWNWSQAFAFVIRYDAAAEAWVPNLLLQGAAMTLRLALWGTILATVIGVVMGLARTSGNLALRLLSRAYVELIRNIPPVVFIFIFYFFISHQLFPAIGANRLRPDSPFLTNGFSLVLLGPPNLFPNFLSGVVCLAMFEAAYVAEIVRAGVQSIEKGQWEAAHAIGLSKTRVLADVVLPQALRRILPALGGQFISLVKDSAMVSLISVQELTFLSNEVASTTRRTFETWLIAAGFYFVMCMSFSLLFHQLERRSSLVSR
jgi:polar amino acid transport system permease protein